MDKLNPPMTDEERKQAIENLIIREVHDMRIKKRMDKIAEKNYNRGYR